MKSYQQPNPKQPLNWSLGKHWLSQGIKLFQVMQKHWYATLLLVGISLSVLSIISAQFSTMVLMMIMPMITAWFYLLSSEQLVSNQLHSGMSQLWLKCWHLLVPRLNQLLFLGVLAVVLNYAMHMVQMGLLNGLQLAPLTPEMTADISLSEAFLRLLINIITGLPVALLMAFSPALIMFNGDSPISAMMRSVKTVLFAWQPILGLTAWLMLLALAAVFIISIVLGLLAGIFGMGIVNIVMLLFMSIMMGVVFSANFISYDALYPVHSDGDDNNAHDNDDQLQEPIYKEI